MNYAFTFKPRKKTQKSRNKQVKLRSELMKQEKVVLTRSFDKEQASSLKIIIMQINFFTKVIKKKRRHK